MTSLTNSLKPFHTPGITVEIAWDGTNWIDESARFIRANGVSDVDLVTRLLNADETNVTLSNNDFRFSFTNTGSAIYAYLGQTGQPMRIKIGWDGVLDTFFYGNITDLLPDQTSIQIKAISSAKRFLGLTCVMAPVGGAKALAIAKTLCLSAGLVEHVDFEIDTGDVIVEYAVTSAGTNLLGELLQLAQTENGRLFFDPANGGRITMWSATNTAAALASPLATITGAHFYTLTRELRPDGVMNDITFSWLFNTFGAGTDADGNPIVGDQPLYSNYIAVTNEIQVLTLSGAGNTGTYRLTFNGVQTAAINRSIVDIPTIQTVLDGTYGTGLLSITGLTQSAAHGVATLTVTFLGVYKATDVPQMTVATSVGVTGSVSTTQAGGVTSNLNNGILIPKPSSFGNQDYKIAFTQGGGGQDNISSTTSWRSYVPATWTRVESIIADEAATFDSGHRIPLYAANDAVNHLGLHGGELNYWGIGQQTDGTYLMNFNDEYTRGQLSGENIPRDAYIRIRIMGTPQGKAPLVQTSKDSTSIARFGDITGTMSNAYKPSNTLAQAVVNREITRRADPTDRAKIEVDGMPLKAMDVIVLTDTTVPGITSTTTKQVLSNEWTYDSKLTSTLTLGAP